MDGGSGINLIYADTLRKMKYPLENLLPSETSFHGIVSGKPIYPMGVCTSTLSSVHPKTSEGRS